MYMEVLRIVVSLICYCSLTFFAVSAWFALRRLQDDVNVMKKALRISTTMTMGSHLKDNFDELEKMKATLRRLVETEQYAEARKLQSAIAHAEQIVQEALQRFKETCGDTAEIIVTHVETDGDEAE